MKSGPWDEYLLLQLHCIMLIRVMQFVNMSLTFHLAIHLFFSLLAGFLAWRIWKKPIVSFLGGVAGGFFVDLDHLIDYFLAFGTNFKLDYFLSGYQFLKSDKIYVLFHGWEYVIILLLLVWGLKSRILRSVFLSIALGLFFHLSTDIIIDGLPAKSYSLAYRASRGFDLKELVYPDHWQKHKSEKLNMPIE